MVNFLQYEGKTTYDSFERLLVERILDAINKKTFPLGTELLIAAILSRADKFINTFQQKVAKKLTKNSVANLFNDFEVSNRLNRRLIETCVKKEIFNDDNEYYVKMQLMIYCKKLLELYSERPRSAEKVIAYKFTSEEIVSQSTGKRKPTVDPPNAPAKRSRRWV